MFSTEENTIQAIASITAILSVIGSCLSLSTLIDKGEFNLKNLKSKQLAVLSGLDLFTAIFFAIGYAGTENNGFCQFQAFMIYFGSLSSVFWNSLIAFQLHLWIIKKKNEKRVSKKLKQNARICFLVSLFVAIALLASGLFGETNTWCWIKEGKDWAKFVFFYLVVLGAWAYNVWVIVRTRAACKDATQNSTERIIRNKMQEHLAIFVFAWFFGLLNFIAEAAAGEPVFATAVLQALCVPLQGFVNSIVYGGIFSEDSLLRVLLCVTTTPDPAKARSVSSDKKSKIEAIKHVKYVPREISIFSTTFNLGEAPMSTVGDVSEWLRDGHDIYAIGLQECMCLDELREAMFAQLGGPEKFVMFKVEIGSDNTRLGFHGFIALTVFVRKEDVESGCIRMTESAAGDVANGANLVVTTAANKGAVGIPLRIHDTSLGFVTTHLPSDSKGKSKLPKRNGNAKSMLKDVVLAADDLGVDVQHTMDHLVLMGDLNYRTKTPAMTNEEGVLIGEGASALLGIAEASLQDMRAMQYDPLWFKRKYALLHGKKSPLYPDKQELQLIEDCEATSLKAWDDVLKHDELLEMIQLGEVFYGFREMMPRFPPTYKRKLNAAGECGDYSRYEDLVKGYSHTGEDKEEVSEEALGRDTMDLSTGSSDSLDYTERPLSVSSLRPTNADMSRSRANSDFDRPVSEPIAKVVAAKKTRRSSVFGFGKNLPPDAAGEDKQSPITPKKGKNRRGSILHSFKSDAQLAVMDEEKKKSKLRPPSYTDRILVHSLRREKLSIDAYGFCDSIRCSDHRPVSTAMTLTVNTEVMPPRPENATEVEGKAKVTPYAILLDIKIKNLDVSIKRAGEVVNPISAVSMPPPPPVAKTVTKPNLESFTEDEEEEGEEENGKELAGDDIESQITLPATPGATDNDFDEAHARAASAKHTKKRGRASRLSVTVIQTSGIEPFEVADDVQPAEVIIICPLPTKDPLIEYRKMFDLMNALGGQKGVDIGGLKVSRHMREQLLQHQNTYSWKDAAQGNIQVSSCGDVSLGVEALVKFLDGKGEDMGEALVSLSDIISAEAFGKPFIIEVPISCGGQFRGKLQAEFTLDRVQERK